MLRRDLLEAVEPERGGEAKRPESVRALARLAIAEANYGTGYEVRYPRRSGT